MQQTYMMTILYCQNYVFWCPDNLRSRYGIDLRSRIILPPASEELIIINIKQERWSSRNNYQNQRPNMTFQEVVS